MSLHENMQDIVDRLMAAGDRLADAIGQERPSVQAHRERLRELLSSPRTTLDAAPTYPPRHLSTLDDDCNGECDGCEGCDDGTVAKMDQERESADWEHEADRLVEDSQCPSDPMRDCRE